MTGYELMTEDQRIEWAKLAEARTHNATMRFTALDAIHLAKLRVNPRPIGRGYKREPRSGSIWLIIAESYQ